MQLLLMCASTRANYWLRCVRPDLAEAFAHRHDASVWECLRQIHQVMMWPESPPRLRSLWVVWDSLPQASRGRLTAQVGLIASLWCTSVTPQWQRPWCKGWSGTHLVF